MKKNADVIVVGTGMGGATTGYALAKAGLKVLFIEKGFSRQDKQDTIRGDFAEQHSFWKKSQQRQQILKASGRYCSIIVDQSKTTTKQFTPFIGSGSGGSSSIYGAILERFKEEDFNPGCYYKNTEQYADIPEQWPISLAEMEPWYQQAEQLYGVRKFVAQQIVPEQISKANKLAWQQLQQNGMHPYQLPTATEGIHGCIDNCQSFLCKHGCKNDSEKCALKPAIEKYQARIMNNCEVLKLISKQSRITALECKQGDKLIRLTADRIILAAGALETPALLLKSDNMANRSGLVGKYLMRHYVDLFAVKIPASQIYSESQKEIGFNDFYITEQGKFGTVQSFGLMPPLEVVIEELIETSDFGLGKSLRWGLKKAFPVIDFFYKKHFSKQLIFASIIEDLPVLENSISIQNNQAVLKYTIKQKEKERIKYLRQQMKQAFYPFSVSLLKQAENNHRLAHACGTCRFGVDPLSSVINKDNRAHDIGNLYITDASFFPTSGGINPSLTIAANALRVADAILAE